MSKRGILMVAVGKVHRDLARKSIASMRSICASVPVRVITDRPEDFQSIASLTLGGQVSLPLNAEVVRVEPFSHHLATRVHKTTAFNHAFDEVTFMVDADTTFLESPEQLLNSDEKCLPHFAMTIGLKPFVDSFRNPHPEVQLRIRRAGNYFPRFNSGAVLFRKTAVTEQLFTEWEAWRARLAPTQDEPALFCALWEMGLLPAPLNPSWNFSGKKIRMLHHTDHSKFYFGSNQ